MSLLIFMYHRARPERHGNSVEVLDAHFGHIARSCANPLPGEPLLPGALNVCLSFDDGYFDFYAKVFPLLIKHRLRAVLAIPAFVVRERVEASWGDRLEVDTRDAFVHPSRGGFCTWPELEEMAASGRVAIAAHSYTHSRLDLPGVNFEMEINVPQTVLGARLRQPVESFMFPYGRYSEPALRSARQRYRFVYRIGGASNRDWNQRVLYRIDGDALASPTAPFSRARLARYRTRYFWNRLRRR